MVKAHMEYQNNRAHYASKLTTALRLLQSVRILPLTLLVTAAGLATSNRALAACTVMTAGTNSANVDCVRNDYPSTIDSYTNDTNSQIGSAVVYDGIYNSGIITLITNNGLITGYSGIYNDDRSDGDIGTLINNGTIHGVEDGFGINHYYGDIGVLTNNGTISGGDAIRIQGTLGLLTNNNKIQASTDYGVDNQGTITELINSSSGSISSEKQHGVSNAWGGTITTLSNFGSITGGTNGFGIYSSSSYGGKILTLNNNQGGNNSTPQSTALTFKGALPTNYNIVILSEDHYGQLAVTDPIGSLNFGISDGSMVTGPRYLGVLQGLSSANINSLTMEGTYGGRAWRLEQQADTLIWDLVFAFGPNSEQTIRALVANRDALRSLMDLRASEIDAMMDYDCATFGENNLCISFQGRYSGSEGAGNGAGVLTAAYRVGPSIRIGGFVDKRVADKNPNNIETSGQMLTVGGFLGYSQHDDGSGLQAKAIVAYNKEDVSVARDLYGEEGDTEAGSGSGNLSSYGVSGEVGYGVPVGPTFLMMPFVGLRQVNVERSHYSESFALGEVEYPISYDDFSQKATTGIAGLRFNGMLAERIEFSLAGGVEHDLTRQDSSYSGRSDIPDLETFSFSSVQEANKTRAFGSGSLKYLIKERQRLIGSVSISQLPFGNSAVVTAMVGYQGAF